MCTYTSQHHYPVPTCRSSECVRTSANQGIHHFVPWMYLDGLRLVDLSSAILAKSTSYLEWKSTWMWWIRAGERDIVTHQLPHRIKLQLGIGWPYSLVLRTHNVTSHTHPSSLETFCDHFGRQKRNRPQLYPHTRRTCIRRPHLWQSLHRLGRKIRGISSQMTHCQRTGWVSYSSLLVYNKMYMYLPMHLVRKESSTTTKLHAVFDVSTSTTSGISLNDTLLHVVEPQYT